MATTSKLLTYEEWLKLPEVEGDGYINSPPELVIEVLSPANTRTERAAKLKDYESLGVPEAGSFLPKRRSWK